MDITFAPIVPAMNVRLYLTFDPVAPAMKVRANLPVSEMAVQENFGCPMEVDAFPYVASEQVSD